MPSMIIWSENYYSLSLLSYLAPRTERQNIWKSITGLLSVQYSVRSHCWLHWMVHSTTTLLDTGVCVPCVCLCVFGDLQFDWVFIGRGVGGSDTILIFNEGTTVSQNLLFPNAHFGRRVFFWFWRFQFDLQFMAVLVVTHFDSIDASNNNCNVMSTPTNPLCYCELIFFGTVE